MSWRCSPPRSTRPLWNRSAHERASQPRSGEERSESCDERSAFQRRREQPTGMRLHRLVLAGIGPFANRAEIDFAQLGANGLFLLEGPTGAGKSTIIDAISFALYGKVAQASGDADRLRSHFAGPDTESWVELIWETQSGIYRIRRTPKYQRPKRRGDGLATVNPTASLWRLGQLDDPATGELLSTRLDEVADEITRAVGLSHAQFVQTVVLPQGEFANFLRASSDDKRALLQKLFGTEQLARVQASLIEQRQQAERRRVAVAESLNRAVHAFIGAAGLASGTADLSDGLSAGDAADFDAALQSSDTEQIAALGQLACDQLRLSSEAAFSACANAQATRQLAQRRFSSAEDLDRRRVRRSALRLRHAQLQAGEPAERALADEIAAAERAAPLKTLVTALHHASDRHTHAVTRAAGSASRLPAGLRDADELSIRAEAERITRLSGALADQVARESELKSLHSAHRSHTKQQLDTSRRIAAYDGELNELAAERAQLSTQRAATAVQAETLASALLRHSRASEVLASAVAATAAETATAQAKLATTEALAREQAAALAVHQLRQRRIAGLAGELGVTLLPGQPCLVCGSCEHPRPARPNADHVSEEQVTTAETALSELASARAAAAEQFSDVRLRWTELNAHSGGLSVAAGQLQLDVATDELDRARAAEAELAAIVVRLSAVDDRTNGVATARHAALTDLEVRAGLLARCQADITDFDRQLAEARAGFATVAERLVDLTGQLAVLDDAATQLAAAQRCEQDASRAATELSKALAEAGLDGEAGFAAAYRTADALDVLRDRLAGIRADWQSTRAGLAAPELGDPALDDEPVDLAVLAKDLAVADQAATDAQARSGSAADRLDQACRQFAHVIAAINLAGEVLRQTAPAIRLGYLVAGLGDNQLRMDLATYVLVWRLEEIVAAANEQLRRVSNGRYLLEHSDAKQGNARSGLGLRVRDLRTDRARDPATLSGGETFYVSLSLALGLADVVRAESGGIDLGTLFIDEGFGSLDSDVLDEVLSVLDGLRAGGRAVGVVSHVAELKARIADRIEVRPNPDGSSRLTVLA
jgi:exonuclease SbcC